MWELLLLLTIIVGIHWWEYRNSVQEYKFAQPATLDKHDELATLLMEKTPIAVEIGSLPWRPEIAENAGWAVTVLSEDGSEMNMAIGQWMTAGKGEKSSQGSQGSEGNEDVKRPPIADPEALATEIELTTGLGDLDAGRPWWWLPGIRDCRVNVLEPGGILSLSWVTAEREWIGCSSGSPLTLWLVHSRYRRFLPSGSDSESVDPWTLTVSDCPWIGRVQYIEVTVKPGWCIGLPAHWGFAVKSEGESWIWSATQHSALSLALGEFYGRVC